MKLEIQPFQGVGNVRFGMTRGQVAASLDSVPERGRRNEYELSDYDLFHGCTFVYYDKDDRCAAIELASPAQAMFQGADLLSLAGERVFEALKAVEAGATIDEDGIEAPGLGVSVYAPDIEDEPDAFVQSVMAYRARYSEDMQAWRREANERTAD